MEKVEPKTILLVEDEALIAMAEAQTLRKFGYTLVTAYSGEKAIEIIDSNPDIHLILMDIDLGMGLDGTQTAEIILKKRDIPIAFLSNHTEPEIVEKTEKLTSYGYILKNAGETVLNASIKMAFKLFEAKRKISESEKYFADLFQQAPLGYHSLNEEGRFIEINQTLLDLLGYGREEILGRWFGEFLPPNELETFRERYAQFKAAGRMQAEFHLMQKNGGRRLFSFNGRVGYKSDGSFCTYGLSADITEKKLIEESLIKSENLLTEMGNIARIGGWEFDVARNVLRWTEGCYSIFEVDSSFIPTIDKILEFYSPSSRLKMEREVQLLMETGNPYDIELEMITGKGNRRIIRTIGKAVVTDGKITHRIGVTQDISDRKQAEMTQKENEKYYRNMGKMAKIGGWEMNLLDHTSKWTDEIYSIYEVDTSFSPSLEKILEFHKPESRRAVQEKLEHSIRTGEPFELEIEITTAKGTLKSLHLKGEIINRDGRISHVAGITQDITEQKRARESLLENQRFLKEVEAIAKVGAWRTDIASLRTKWTDEIYAIFEVDSSFDPTMENIMGFLTPESQQIHQNAVYNLIATGKPYDIEVEIATAKGTERWIRIIGRAGYSNGNFDYIVGVIQDITEKKIAEEKIKSLLKEKDLILKEVQHRIKNNMNTMTSILSLHLHSLSEPSAVAALKDAKNRFQSMGILYDKLYRSENLHEMSVKDYLPSLIDEILVMFPNRGRIKRETKIDDFSLAVKELSALGIIVNELVSNSMKYAFPDNAAGTITVTASKMDRLVTVCVADDGTGMPETIGPGNSSGFGLVLVAGLIKQLNGNIEIDREKGTRFILEFEG